GNAAARPALRALPRDGLRAAHPLAHADRGLAAVRRRRPRAPGGLRAAQGLPRQRYPRGRARRARAAEFAGHAHARRPGRRPARPRADVGLPDRRPRPLRLGPRHGRGPPPPRGLRVPAGLRARAPPPHPSPAWRSAMSRLRIFADDAPDTVLFESRDGGAIAAELAKIGVTFERWQASRPVAAGATPEEVMAAYRDDIDRIRAERGFTTVDVVSIAPDHPKREEMRRTF